MDKLCPMKRWQFSILIFELALFAVIFLMRQVGSIPQSNIAVVTAFGKYQRIMREGLNVKLPWEKIAFSLSLQNRALQMEFQAITRDQANVKFSTMVVYAVANADEETIKRAVFSFASYGENLTLAWS